MREEFERILTGNILPFWMHKMTDYERGGFYGRIDGRGVLHPEWPKGAILNARILWTFSAAYRVYRNDEYLVTAQRAFDYIDRYFVDKEFGGAFWEIDCRGEPLQTKKLTYVQGFMVYGFSEFYRATGSQRSLELAIAFFKLIERYKDHENGGYFEAFTRDWQPLDDMRLSDRDANEKKSMNTHLHVLEPYTNLLRVWRDEALLTAQKELIGLFAEKIVNQETYHLGLFFDEYWELKSSVISYGHDIEASWLLVEAAQELGDLDLLDKIELVALNIADAAAEGLDSDGGLSYESTDGVSDSEKHWWVQAEAVVGFYNAYVLSGNEVYRNRSLRIWDFIKSRLIDSENGEWYWSVGPDGTINTTKDKAGFWKCPYHNSRMCLEMNYALRFAARK